MGLVGVECERDRNLIRNSSVGFSVSSHRFSVFRNSSVGFSVSSHRFSVGGERGPKSQNIDNSVGFGELFGVAQGCSELNAKGTETCFAIVALDFRCRTADFR